MAGARTGHAPAMESVIDPGALVGERYRIQERIDRGGMASVWRARDRRLDRAVAVKVIAPELAGDEHFVERWRAEARTAARLRHPHLLGIHDLGFDGERPFLVMELVDGETLADRLRRDEPGLDLTRLARTLLDVLATLHEGGIVHGDVRPANVLYGRDGRIRLTDFGVARILGTSESAIREGETAAADRDYTAPELRDHGSPTPASDLYSLGVLLDQAGAGETPLARLVRRLRAPKAEDRPESARLALISIAGIGEGPPPGPPQTTAALAAPEAAAPDPAHVPASPTVRAARRSHGRPAAVPGAEGAAPGMPAVEAGGAGEDAGPPTPPSGARRTYGASGGRAPRILAGGLLAVAAVLVVALVAFGGGGEGGGGSQRAAASKPKGKDHHHRRKGNGHNGGRSGSRTHGAANTKAANPPAPAKDTQTEPTPTSSASASAPEPAAGLSGSELNDRGYALLQQGEPAAAVPTLRRAVDALGPDDGLTYAYALFNLGSALRQSGHPDEAIPILKQRLRYPDQRATVRAELQAARKQAGES